MNYKVIDVDRLLVGSAQDILQQIRDKESINEDIGRMTVAQYDDALINNADYLLPGVTIDALREQTFETKYDQALKFLSAMPSSGTVILDSSAEPFANSGKRERRRPAENGKGR